MVIMIYYVDNASGRTTNSSLVISTKYKRAYKPMKCKNVKGKDGFTIGKIYDVLFAGRVYWVVNDYGERICDSDESFESV